MSPAQLKKEIRGRDASVLSRKRYKFTKPQFFQNLTKKYQSGQIAFLTVHKSKARQADYVVILG